MIKTVKKDIGFQCLMIEIQVSIIPQEVFNKIKDKSITHNISTIQSDDSIMCKVYCIDFIKYMIAAKSFLDCTNFFFLMTLKKRMSR